MQPHLFTPDSPGSTGCATCMMGERHRFHTPVTTREQVTPARVNARLDREVDAAFHELWGTNGPRARVLYQLVIANRAGATDDELTTNPELADLSENTIRPRRTELADAGLVVRLTRDDGALVKRTTRTGSKAQVWVISEACRRLIAADNARTSQAAG